MCKKGGEIACCAQETRKWAFLGESVGGGTVSGEEAGEGEQR